MDVVPTALQDFKLPRTIRFACYTVHSRASTKLIAIIAVPFFVEAGAYEGDTVVLIFRTKCTHDEEASSVGWANLGAVLSSSSQSCSQVWRPYLYSMLF